MYFNLPSSAQKNISILKACAIIVRNFRIRIFLSGSDSGVIENVLKRELCALDDIENKKLKRVDRHKAKFRSICSFLS